MKKHLESVIVTRSVGVLASILVPLVVAAMGISDANGSPYPDTLPGGAINFGAASPFTVLTSSNDTISGASDVHGNVGIQSGTFSLDKNSNVFGNLVYHKGVTRSIKGTVSGTISNDDVAIDNALLDAQSLSDAAAAESATPGYPYTNINLSKGNLTLDAGMNEKVVLNLTNFVLFQSNLTLKGDGDDTFIFNITGNFSVSGNSNISLVNVPASNVLFNVRGTGSAVTGNSSNISGNLLALNRTVTISGSSNITGRVIANQVNISNSSNVFAVTPTTNP